MLSVDTGRRINWRLRRLDLLRPRLGGGFDDHVVRQNSWIPATQARNHVGRLRQQLILVGRTISPTSSSSPLSRNNGAIRIRARSCFNQRLPRLRAQRNSIEETPRSVRRDHLAFWSLPEDRLELLGITVEAGGYRIVAAHDCAEDRSASLPRSRILAPPHPRSRATIRSA